MSLPASAAFETLSDTDFEGFTTGASVDGQGGWGIGFNLGPPGVIVDEAVVDDGTGNTVFRFSNAEWSGSFNDLPYAPRPAGIPFYPVDTANNPVLGQPGLFAGETSTGAEHREFFASFRFRSTTGAAQPGLSISTSPDNGAGGRMGYVSMVDTGSGIDLVTWDIDAGGNFVGPLTIATGLNYTDWHEISISMLFRDGPSNDLVYIRVDGSLIHVGTSWEDYFAATDPASYPLGVPVQTLTFAAGSPAVPANSGNGFYFDDVLIQVGSSPAPTLSQWAQILLGLALIGLAGWRMRRRESLTGMPPTRG